jgi:hypothetical protein
MGHYAHEQELVMSGTSFLRPVAAAVLALVLFGLAACETGPTYRPRGPGEVVGYRDRQIAPNRYRVSFAGGSATTREDVEDYLLRRAAEVTLGAGYAYFTFDDRGTDARTYYRTAFITPGFGPFDYPYYWRPYYWSSWEFGPSWRTGEFIPVTRYTAYSEIVMLTPEQAENNPQAISAADALARLRPLEPRA